MSVSRESYPLLEGLAGYSEMNGIEDQVEKLSRSYEDAVDSVLKALSEFREFVAMVYEGRESPGTCGRFLHL